MQNKAVNILTTGCLVAGTAVAIGAFGAHGLKNLLLENGRTEVFETAVKYHFYHAFAILLVGLLAQKNPTRWHKVSFVCFLVGLIFFSGALYILAITNQSILGAIAPIGGTLLIAGWVSLMIGIRKSVA
ncbi:MAG: DUF423 domain-containing protein [Bacteroidota bacterium]